MVSQAQEFLNVHPLPFYKSLPLQNCFFCWKPTGLQAQTQEPHCPSSNPDWSFLLPQNRNSSTYLMELPWRHNRETPMCPEAQPGPHSFPSGTVAPSFAPPPLNPCLTHFYTIIIYSYIHTTICFISSQRPWRAETVLFYVFVLSAPKHSISSINTFQGTNLGPLGELCFPNMLWSFRPCP